MVLKFEVYCKVRQSDGRILHFVRRFDSLPDVDRFIKQYSKLLCPDWKIVQTHTNVTPRERELMSYQIIDAYEQDLPF